MSNVIPGGPAAQVIEDRPAAAPVGTVCMAQTPSWPSLPVFDGKVFSDTWLETLNLQFGVKK